MEEEKLIVDVRELRMERGLYDRASQMPGQAWLTLGPFNWMYVSRVESREEEKSRRSVPLDRLRGFVQPPLDTDGSRNTYFQFTYLMREYPEELTPVVDSFWSVPSRFMLVTRVNGNNPWQRSLEDNIEVSLGAAYTSMTDGEREERRSSGCIYELYRTIDLTDAVVVLRAQTMVPLLRAMGALYKNSQIGDIYSVCCIAPDVLSGPPAVLQGDIVPFLSLRFSVKNSAAFDGLLQALQDLWHGIGAGTACPPPRLVTGPEDINVVFSDISSLNICKLYAFLLSSEKGQLRNAADDIVSRIGINNAVVPLVEGTPGTGGGDAVPAAQTLSRFYKGLKKRLLTVWKEKKELPWLPPLLEVLNSLISISQNSILRQLCYILASPLDCAIQRLEMPGDKWQWQEDINQFLAGVVNIIEYTARLESALVQSPEIRPRIVDIPSSILEYDLALADSCAKYLKARETGQDGCDQQTYAFLLNPCLCTNITIHDRFNVSDGTDKSRLLYVEIPLSLIYNPFEVACDLIHEVSHHSGSMTRQRGPRQEALLDTAAFLLAQEFGISGKDTASGYAMDQIVSLIKDHARGDGALSIKGLETIGRELYTGIMGTLRDLAALELIVQNYIGKEELNNSSAAELYDRFLTRRTALLENTGNDVIQENLDTIIMLYSECYADISMMSLLCLSPGQYVSLFNAYYAVLMARPDGEKKCTDYANLITRIGLVLLAQDKMVHERENADASLARAVNGFIANWKRPGHDSTDFPGFWEGGRNSPLRVPYFPDYISGRLLVYLHDCFMSIRQLDESHQEEKDDILRKFRLFAESCLLASDDFFEVISNFRAEVLQYCRGNTDPGQTPTAAVL